METDMMHNENDAVNLYSFAVKCSNAEIQGVISDVTIKDSLGMFLWEYYSGFYDVKTIELKHEFGSVGLTDEEWETLHDSKWKEEGRVPFYEWGVEKLDEGDYEWSSGRQPKLEEYLIDDEYTSERVFHGYNYRPDFAIIHHHLVDGAYIISEYRDMPYEDRLISCKVSSKDLSEIYSPGEKDWTGDINNKATVELLKEYLER